jgi:acyl transferase domain-containing protein
MLAVPLSESQIMPYIEAVERNFGSRGLSIACFNSERNLTISGDAQQVDDLQVLLQTAEQPFHRLKIDLAYHSPHMNAIAAMYKSLIHGLEPGDATKARPINMVSSVTGQRIRADELQSSDYWIRNLVSPVKFRHAMAELCIPPTTEQSIKLDRSHLNATSVDVIVELGPHSALRGPIHDILQACNNGGKTEYMSLLRRDHDAVRTILAATGNLFCLGYPVNIARVNQLDTLLQEDLAVITDLPEYTFDHSKTYWCESRLSSGLRFGAHGKHELLGKPVSDWNPLDARWRNFIKTSNLPWVEDHKVTIVRAFVWHNTNMGRFNAKSSIQQQGC